MIVLICCLSLFLVTLDSTILNVALPSIRRDLHAGIAGLQWALDGYTVVVASLLMAAGSLADAFGRRRVFQVGLVMFSVGSLLCSVAQSIPTLVCFRALQAVGGSMLNPVAMSIVVGTFEDRDRRARALGVWGATFGVSMAAGPAIGGLLVDHLGWRAIFWVNVPVGVLALLLSMRFISESHARRPRSFDVIGQALLAAALLLLTSTLIDVRRVGWSAWTTVAGIALATLALLGVLVRSSRRADALLDPRWFTNIAFSSAMGLAVLAFASFAGFLFLSSLYLQDARGLSASAAGRMTMPIALGLMVSSPLSGRLVAARRASAAIAMSGAAIGVGALMLTRLEVDTPAEVLLVAYALFGVGMGSIGPPVNTAALTGVPPSQASLGAALASTSRQVGAALGVALAGALLGASGEADPRAHLTPALHSVFWMVGAGGLLMVLVGIAVRRDRAVLRSAAT